MISNRLLVRFQYHDFSRQNESSNELLRLPHQLDSKNLLVKTFYEKNDGDALLSSISSFASFIKKNKLISEYQRAAYLNFLKLIDKLHYTYVSERKSWQELNGEITTTKPVADVTWLLKKYSEKEDLYKGL